jgi:prolipoprotein diacylglyceryltransferase
LALGQPNRAFARFNQMHGTVTKIPPRDENRLGPGGWFAIVVLLGFLLAAVTYAVRAWTAMDGVKISLAGWIFMGLGVVFTILVGGGLMALVFYSNRNNFDQ